MGLKFDIEKNKNIAMVVETSGIEDVNRLTFTFNINVGSIRYGFPCKLKEGKVEIRIPALKEVIQGLKPGKYNASLDVTGDKNYFLQPYNEDVELTVEPKVGVIIDVSDKEDIKEALTASISAIIDIDEVTKPVEKIVEEGISNNEDRKIPVIGKGIVNKMFR